MTREKQLRLFEEYHARTRIVYLETPWQENLRRNADRRYAVPEATVNRMLESLDPPEITEAHHVEWICV